jgi:hypothetical protein
MPWGAHLKVRRDFALYLERFGDLATAKPA